MEGAGTPYCNGIYRVSAEVAENVPTVAGPKSSEDETVAPKYTHQAEGFPLLTLFRCKMRTKAYWWFIRWAAWVVFSPGCGQFLHKCTHVDECGSCAPRSLRPSVPPPVL